MLFKPEHIRQIRSGEKTVTRRDWETPQATEGGVYIASTEMFTSHQEADCYIRVNRVYEEPLGAITPAQADREGGYTVDEFEHVWREINGDYDPAKRVTVVEFEYVGRSHPDEDESEQSELATDGGRDRHSGEATTPMASHQTLHEFVDAKQHVDDLYGCLAGERFAVVHVRDYKPGEPPINWFIRRVRDRGAEEAERPEYIVFNPGPEAFSAGGEETVREFIQLADEARIVSLRDAPRWGDGSALDEVIADG